jgi:hypothetical protein
MNIHQNAANNAVNQGTDEISERRLWTAVLLQALEDWNSSSIRRKREAEKFLFESAADFARVCMGAGLTPASVLSRLRRMQSVVRPTAPRVSLDQIQVAA